MHDQNLRATTRSEIKSSTYPVPIKHVPDVRGNGPALCCRKMEILECIQHPNLVSLAQEVVEPDLPAQLLTVEEVNCGLREIVSTRNSERTGG